MKTVDLNCDLGESFGAYTSLMEMDRLILPHISSANVACGFHAGDPFVMRKTVEAALENGTAIGAHPGLPDLQGFGRRMMKISAEEAENYVIYQTGALQAIAAACGGNVRHVKPHGALYNMAAKDTDIAEGIARGIKSACSNILFVCLFGSCMVQAAQKYGIPYACEVFADRAYNDDGTLVPRTQSGSVITDEKEAVRRTLRMVLDGEVTSITGKTVSVRADTICVHGDNPKAVEFVRQIRAELEKNGVQIAPPDIRNL